MAMKLPLNDPRLRHILAYPSSSNEEYLRRVRELEKLGIDYIVLEGKTIIHGLRVIGKGCDSIVVKAILDGTMVALKVRRLDSGIKSMVREGMNLALANTVGVGPRCYGFSDDIVVYGFIEGKPLEEVIQRGVTSKELKLLLIDLLIQCYLLDRIGLDHGELSRPTKHVLVNQRLHPVIIDFSASSTTRKARNVSAISGYLFFSGNPVSRRIAGELMYDRAGALGALRRYLRSGSWKEFMNYLESLKLF